jgi:phosphatidylethanolamine-binding protein (PEBP) family uncharacterized protein
MVRRRPTHRERRVEQKLARAARASAASAGEGAGARVATTSAPSRADDVNQPDREVPAELPRVDFFHWVLVDLPPRPTVIAEGVFDRKSFHVTKRRRRRFLRRRTSIADWESHEENSGQ